MADVHPSWLTVETDQRQRVELELERAEGAECRRALQDCRQVLLPRLEQRALGAQARERQALDRVGALEDECERAQVTGSAHLWLPGC